MRVSASAVIALAVIACAPSPIASPLGSTPTPVASPNPIALAPNDCTYPPPASGLKTHSAALAATVTLPAGWFENTAEEGQGGAQVPFVLDLPSGTLRAPEAIWGDSLTTSATPHMAAAAEAAYTPGSGTVIARGDCTVASSPASFFESSFFGAGGGYSLYIGHGGVLVRLVILFWPETRDSTMPQVKSILGSWQWDQT